MIADDDEKAKAARKQQERLNKRNSNGNGNGNNRRSGDGGDISIDGVLDGDEIDVGSKKMKLEHSVDNGIFDRLQQQQPPLQQLHQHVMVGGPGILGGQMQVPHTNPNPHTSFVYPHQQQQQQQLNVQQMDAIQSLERFYLEREKLFNESELEKEKSRQQHDLLADLDRRKYIDERLNELQAKVDSQAQMLGAALSLLEKIAVKFNVE